MRNISGRSIVVQQMEKA